MKITSAIVLGVIISAVIVIAIQFGYEKGYNVGIHEWRPPNVSGKVIFNCNTSISDVDFEGVTIEDTCPVKGQTTSRFIKNVKVNNSELPKI